MFSILSLVSWIIFCVTFVYCTFASKPELDNGDLFFFLCLPFLLTIIAVFVAKNMVMRIVGIIQIVLLLLAVRWLIVEVLKHPLSEFLRWVWLWHTCVARPNSFG